MSRQQIGTARMVKCIDCPRMFEQQPYTNRKRCQPCAGAHESVRKRITARKKAIINHDDCECGGCAGIDHNFKGQNEL